MSTPGLTEPEPELDPDRWQRLQDWFGKALDGSTLAREALVEKLREEDPALARELGEMLRAHTDTPLAIEDGVLAPSEEGGLVGRRIGPYRIVRILAHGGMGEVYLAERDDPYLQQVALKVVRPGFVGRELRARFLLERQILAGLSHACIARLLDGGVTEDGRPYLVMEYVEGVPLTDWCEQQHLGIKDRLRLFITACRAVDFAHRNLVVHRDLKPSNLLVTPAGEAKLLDFGIAKLLEAEPRARELSETGAGLGLMTPEHAAPEQFRGQAITTATDVYALGVLLYMLLGGRKPHRIEGGSLTDLWRDVCEKDPPPPSQASAPRHRAEVEGDLDAIVLKALRKEPEQRYGSAALLADDIVRHLEGRPVMARRGGRLYRAERFLRRNLALVSGVVAVVILVLAFSAVTLRQSRQVAKERDRARSERDAAEQVAQILVGLFETSDPTKVPGGDALTVRELLTQSETRVLRQLEGQPLLRARMERTLGEMYLARSDLAPAERHLKAALEQLQKVSLGEGVEAAAVFRQMARLARRRGDEQAVPMLRRSLAWAGTLHGEQSLEVATASRDLAMALPASQVKEREELFGRSLDLRRRMRPQGHPEIAESLYSLALLHFEADRHDQAEALFREALTQLEAHPERGPNHPITLSVMGDLGALLMRRARFADAESMQREVLARQTRVFGAESAVVANTLNNLATTQANQGNLEGAASTYMEVRKVHARILGPNHWETANATRNQARALELLGRYQEALPLMREAYAAARLREGDGDRMRLVMQGQLGSLLVRTGRPEEGVRLLRQSYAALALMFPNGHAHVADTAVAVARALLSGRASAKELAEAERSASRAVEIRGAQLQPSHPKVAEARSWLGIVRARSGQAEEAVQLLTESIPPLSKWGIADPADLAEARRSLRDAQAVLSRPGR